MYKLYLGCRAPPIRQHCTRLSLPLTRSVCVSSFLPFPSFSSHSVSVERLGIQSCAVSVRVYVSVCLYVYIMCMWVCVIVTCGLGARARKHSCSRIPSCRNHILYFFFIPFFIVVSYHTKVSDTSTTTTLPRRRIRSREK